MLRQYELAFIKALSTFQVSPAVLKELRMALSRRKKPQVRAGIRSTMPEGGTTIPQLSSSQLAGKRKANELATRGTRQSPRAILKTVILFVAEYGSTL
jgi:hypothetical protein